MTTTQAQAATYEQLADRLSEALDDNARLADQVDRLERECAEQARQLGTMRGA